MEYLCIAGNREERCENDIIAAAENWGGMRTLRFCHGAGAWSMVERQAGKTGL